MDDYKYGGYTVEGERGIKVFQVPNSYAELTKRLITAGESVWVPIEQLIEHLKGLDG